jgi:hypothetical protein
VLQTNVLAPLAESVAEPPGQITDGEALTLTTGLGLTVTVTLADAEHPLALVPVTEYVVVALGLTTMLAPVWPVLHIYVLAPVAVSVVDSPWQITDTDAEAFTEMAAPTVTVTVAVVEQPLVVPVTE